MKHIPIKLRHSLWLSIEMCVSITIVISSGCSSRSGQQTNLVWKLDEHGNPEFKPHDLADAMEQLRSRFTKITSESGIDRQAQIMEFQQIIRWLPEYAADTDIKREAWEQFFQISNTMLMMAESRPTHFFREEQTKDLQSFIDRLNHLIPIATESPIRPGQ